MGRMRAVTVTNKHGRTKDFDSLRQAIDWLNQVYKREDEFEAAYVRIPKNIKDGLRKDKARYGVPMSAQIAAFYLKGRSSPEQAKRTEQYRGAHA